MVEYEPDTELRDTEQVPLSEPAGEYADGIEAWLKGGYMSFPFQSGNIDRVYGNKRLMLMPGR